ncbi:uncharacterized protein FA14DRAFT_162242 [Meira miltonrushii]|uniref:Uncharacterized protein n=1 Tax=Meira miltonrushii TaxID=1280837 RepID=A0A316V2U1_9BASI|nr:uncharacterized protein FA14DRAFT_162242 [Meira miltonrushii]PWN31879.1 hypothetical protein FA14DRAFT_162242 [Meira miltonrushii]
MPNSGRSLSSILGTSHFNKGRSIGLTKKRSVPSLHLNRREPPKARKSMLIKLEHKKKKGQTNDCSDDEEANPFKRREGESEQAYMLRVCDEEGNHDVDNSKSRDRQDFDGNGKEAEEFIPDDDEDEHIDRGEEE